MIKIEGKGGISATLIKDSISEAGIRLMTYEVTFHRYILAEYNTHRMFSRNAASTRAIPLIKMLQQIADQPAMPIFYGKNQPGMSAAEELDDTARIECTSIIYDMMEYCSKGVAKLNELGLHKQHAGRYLEPWGFVKGVLSFTEGDNWNWLRDDDAAQPEIRELCLVMKEAADKSVPQLLKAGEYHLPYVYSERYVNGTTLYYEGDSIRSCEIDLEDAIKVSCSRAAAVSYRGEDYGLEKCKQLYDRLVGSEKKHSSALEHVATPMKHQENDNYTGYSLNDPMGPEDWEAGISHMDKEEQLWSGNFRGWRQYRKTIPGENYTGEQ